MIKQIKHVEFFQHVFLHKKILQCKLQNLCVHIIKQIMNYYVKKLKKEEVNSNKKKQN
jgi:hypothetical protein